MKTTLKTQESLNGQIKCQNFEILRFGQVHGSQPEKTVATVRFRNPNFALDQEVDIPLSAIRGQKLKEYIPEAFFLEDVPPERQYKEIANRLNKALGHSIPFTLLPQGYSDVSDMWYYVMGDLIIGDEHHRYYPYNPHNIHIDDGKQYTDQKCYEWCKKFCKQSPSAAALFLVALAPYLRPITEALNLPARVENAYVVGESGSGKTSCCELLLKLGTSVPVGVNLASDKSAIASSVMLCRDKCMLIDDLCLSSSSRMMDQKTTRLSELLQASSAGGRVTVKNQDINLDFTGLLITAEYLLDNNSSINRTVVIPFESVDTDALSDLQANQCLFQGFLIKFIEWLCKNHERIMDEVRGASDSGMLDMKFAHGHPSEYIGFHRVATTHRLLKLARYVVIRYWQQVLLKDMNGMSKLLESGITSSVTETLNRIKRKSSLSPVAEILAEVFASDPHNIVATNPEKYFYKSHKVFLRYGNRIYFSGEHLVNYLESQLGEELSVKGIGLELTRLGLLAASRENTAKLPIELRKYSTKRYYKLSVRAVCDFTESVYPDALSRSNSPIVELNPFVKD